MLDPEKVGRSDNKKLPRGRPKSAWNPVRETMEIEKDFLRERDRYERQVHLAEGGKQRDQNERRRKRRRDIIDEYSPDRYCPRCGEGPKVRSRQWVVKKRFSKILKRRELDVVCRSCDHELNNPEPKFEVIFVSFVVFKVVDTQWQLDAQALTNAVYASDYPTERTFAARAGWSRGYQRTLMKGGQLSVKQDTKATICTVLSVREHPMFHSPISMFLVDGKRLSQAIDLAELSKKAFCKRVQGFTPRRLNRLIVGEGRELDALLVDRIKRVLKERGVGLDPED